MKRENIDFFCNSMAEQGFLVKRFQGTPENRDFVGFQIYYKGVYVDCVAISDNIKEEFTDYYFVKFINACKIIGICKSLAEDTEDDETI